MTTARRTRSEVADEAMEVALRVGASPGMPRSVALRAFEGVDKLVEKLCRSLYTDDAYAVPQYRRGVKSRN